MISTSVRCRLPLYCSIAQSFPNLISVIARNKHTSVALGGKKRQKEGRKNKTSQEDQNNINWYPGHIAKAERELATFLKKVDVVVEVRDARIPFSTTHPSVSSWVGPHKTIIVVMLRVDLTSPRCLSDWKNYYDLNPPYSTQFTSATSKNQMKKIYYIDGKSGKGNINGLRKNILQSGIDINKKRKAKGMMPRPVRAAVIGFPNVGKSSLINRILGRKLARTQNVAGYTRKLQWIRIGRKVDEEIETKNHMTIEMLDSPGIIPVTQLNKKGAMKLAICNDIGAAAYDHTQAAALLCDQLNAIAIERKGYVNISKIKKRYGISEFESMTGEDIIHELAAKKYDDQICVAADVFLSDFRKGLLGQIGLEIPPLVHNQNHELSTEDTCSEQPNDEISETIEEDFGDDTERNAIMQPSSHSGIKNSGPFDGW